MSVSHKYELALHLKSLRNIGIRQSCQLQIRTIVYHKNSKKQTITAIPYELINLEEGNVQPNFIEDQQALLDDVTFLSPKLLVKHTDKNVSINCMCIFKGEIELPSQKHQHQLDVYCELIWYLGKETEVAGQWKGHSRLTAFQSYADVYFSSHFLTCSVEAYVHCVMSDISVQNPEAIAASAKDSKFFNHQGHKLAPLYDACMDPLIESYGKIEAWLAQFKGLHQPDMAKKKAQGKNKIFGKYSNVKNTDPDKTDLELQKTLNSLPQSNYIQNIKVDGFNFSIAIYQSWKELLNMFNIFPETDYLAVLKQKYYLCLEKDHWNNRILIEGDTQQTSNRNSQAQKQHHQLCFSNIEQHNSQIKLTAADLKLLETQLQHRKEKIIVLVHGFQASSFDMEMIGMYFKYRNPGCHIFISESNEGETEGMIEESGHRLALEIKNYIICREFKNFSISFIGHSLGGIIIRAALPYLQLYKKNFDCFVSICSPHMGYLFHTSTIVTTSLWVMNQVKKDKSMIELSMSDNKDLTKCYMYELSERSQLAWFQTVILIGSREDEYVPFTSATLQNIDFYYQSETAKVFQAMLNNILKPIEGKVIRLEIVFNDKVQDLSTFIGRTAHIKVLSFLPIIDLYCHLISKRI